MMISLYLFQQMFNVFLIAILGETLTSEGNLMKKNIGKLIILKSMGKLIQHIYHYIIFI